MEIDNEAIKEHVIKRLPQEILNAESKRIISFINEAYQSVNPSSSDESMVIYGGAAVMLYRAHIEESPRTTSDVDIETYKGNAINIHFKSEIFGKYFQVNNVETFLIEPDWRKRLIPTFIFVDSLSFKSVWLLNPYDIVTTKIKRFESRDIEDCGVLIETYELDRHLAEVLLREAISCYPLSANKYNLRAWQDRFEEIFDCDVEHDFRY